MLLSMYLSYHWAGTVKLRSYLIRITLSILVMSFLSVIFPISMLTIIFFPLLLLTNLSWPALFAWHWGRTYGAETLRYISVYNINFFTITITTHVALEYFLIAFLISCFVNILGVLFGCLIGKKLEIQLFHHELWNTFWGFVGICCMVLGAALGAINNLVAAYSLVGFGMLLLGTIFVSRLLGPFPWIIKEER